MPPANIFQGLWIGPELSVMEQVSIRLVADPCEVEWVQRGADLVVPLVVRPEWPLAARSERPVVRATVSCSWPSVLLDLCGLSRGGRPYERSRGSVSLMKLHCNAGPVRQEEKFTGLLRLLAKNIDA